MNLHTLKRIAAAVPGTGRLRHELKRTLTSLIEVPEDQALRARVAQLEHELEMATAQSSSAPQWVPPGHFFSPIPSLELIDSLPDSQFAPREMVGIDLRESQQFELLRKFIPLYAEQPFSAERTADRRYAFVNPAYSYGDGLGLYCMLRHLKPKRIIEVGSGHSSCVMLDTNELFFENAIDCTFIEPYPELLHSLVRESERSSLKIIPQRVQDLPLDTFAKLEAGDILFIDSTHVAKIGGDVPYLYFEVLPRLPKGVLVHIHDVFYPMEYPKEWIREGRAWNEQYILQAFLTFNARFEVVYYAAYMMNRHRDFFEQRLPLFLRNGGAQIWLRS